MAYNSKYTGQQVEALLDQIANGNTGGSGGAEPMICAYTIGSYTANHIELNNHTYNGQTMDYREGAIISITNPFNKDIVFEGGTLTLDGNEYEAAAFTLKVGATTLFSLGTNPGVLSQISSVVESNSGGSSEGGSSAYAEVNHGTSDRTFELTPNTFHVWDEMTALTLTLGAETSGVANEYLFQFTSGSTPTTLTLPDDIKFSEDLVIEANKIYQISILKGLGSVLSWDSVTLIENKATYNEINATVTFQYPVASDLIVEVGMEPININAGEQSGTIVGVPEPGAEIRSITPTNDSTYYYTF